MPSLLTRTIWSNGYMQIVQCSFARCLLWYHLEYGDTQPFSILLLWYRKSNLLDLVNSQFRKWWTLSYNKYFRKGFSGWENKEICDFFKDTRKINFTVVSLPLFSELYLYIWRENFVCLAQDEGRLFLFHALFILAHVRQLHSDRAHKSNTSLQRNTNLYTKGSYRKGIKFSLDPVTMLCTTTLNLTVDC